MLSLLTFPPPILFSILGKSIALGKGLILGGDSRGRKESASGVGGEGIGERAISDLALAFKRNIFDIDVFILIPPTILADVSIAPTPIEPPLLLLISLLLANKGLSVPIPPVLVELLGFKSSKKTGGGRTGSPVGRLPVPLGPPNPDTMV